MPFVIFPDYNKPIYWGEISGLISNQSDLKEILDNKSSSSHQHVIYMPFSIFKGSYINIGPIAQKILFPLYSNSKAKIMSIAGILGSGTASAKLLINANDINLPEFNINSIVYQKVDIYNGYVLHNNDIIQITITNSSLEAEDLSIVITVEIYL